MEPGPHWWEASALTTTPSLYPNIKPSPAPQYINPSSFLNHKHDNVSICISEVGLTDVVSYTTSIIFVCKRKWWSLNHFEESPYSPFVLHLPLDPTFRETGWLVSSRVDNLSRIDRTESILRHFLPSLIALLPKFGQVSRYPTFGQNPTSSSV